MICQYCKSKFIEDARGNCGACGAPSPSHVVDANTYEPLSVSDIMDMIKYTSDPTKAVIKVLRLDS